MYVSAHGSCCIHVMYVTEPRTGILDSLLFGFTHLQLLFDLIFLLFLLVSSGFLYFFRCCACVGVCACIKVLSGCPSSFPPPCGGGGGRNWH